MGKVRVRQHVNPLRAEYQRPTGPVDWSAAFEDPTLPLAVDLGCGPGRFLLLLQRRAAAGRVGEGVPNRGRCNYLGVEIRRPVRRHARARAISHTHPASRLWSRGGALRLRGLCSKWSCLRAGGHGALPRAPASPTNLRAAPSLPQLVDRANEWARQLGCAGRVHYVFANATVSLRGILEGYPGAIEVRSMRARPSAPPRAFALKCGC
jgi:SAM-dependent methyltransferase